MKCFICNLLILSVIITCGLYSQSVDTRFWGTNGSVYTIAVDGNSTYIGGYFTYIGPSTGSGVVLDPVTGEYDQEMPLVIGQIRTVISDGSKGWYIGGDFTHVDGVERPYLAHIKKDKTLDFDWIPEPNGIVTSLARDKEGFIYAGGYFSSIGGSARNHIAKLDNDTGLAVSDWSSSPDDIVNSIICDDSDNVYIGGEFEWVNSFERKCLAKLDRKTGSLNRSWVPAVTGTEYSGMTYIDALTQDKDGDIYIGGSFYYLNGIWSRGFAKIDSTYGHKVTDWSTNVEGTVSCLHAYNDSLLYIGGNIYFDGNSSNTQHLVRLEMYSGQGDKYWNPQPDYIINSVTTDHTGNVFTGGYFDEAGGLKRHNIAKLNYNDGSAVTDWNPGASKEVNVIVTDDYGNMFAGGSFSSVGGIERQHIAKINNVTGEADPEWNAYASNGVYSIAVDSEGDLFVGGGFWEIGGIDQVNAAKIRGINGSVDQNWRPVFNEESWDVSEVCLDSEGNVYIGGEFDTVNGVERHRLAKLDKNDASLDPDWDPKANFFINGMSIDENDDVYVCGEFVNVGGEYRFRAAKLNNTDGHAYPDWAPYINDTVNFITSDGLGNVYICGDFDHVEGYTRNYVARLDSETGKLDVDWDPYPGDGVAAVWADNNGHVYMSMGIRANNVITESYITKLNDTTGEADPGWIVETNSLAGNIVPDNENRLMLGGYFTTVNSLPASYFAVISMPTGIEEEPVIPDTHSLFQNYPNPFNNTTQISYSINHTAFVNLSVFNIKGEIVSKLIDRKMNKGSYSVNFNADNLNSGIYYYRLEIDGISKETKRMIFLK